MKQGSSLRGMPSCTHCVSWSCDGIIAVGQSDHVILMLPNWQVDFEDLDNAWFELKLYTNLFSVEEFPRQTLASASSFSAGEEISASFIIAMKWSPPGFGNHKRSLLGILTSNLLFSLWEPQAHPPTLSSSWKRAIILNKALADYFELLDIGGDEALDHPTDEEGLRRFQRIRSFVWASPQPIQNASHLVAVANDDAKVLIVELDRSYEPHNALTASVTAMFDITRDSHVRPTSAKPTFVESLFCKRYPSDLAWSPWVFQNDHSSSLIAFSSPYGIRFRMVIQSSDSNKSLTTRETGLEIDFQQSQARTGLFDFNPVVEDNCVFFLAEFDGRMSSYKIDVPNEVIVESYYQDRGEWDEVSATAWVPARIAYDQVIYVAPHISLKESTEAMFDARTLKPFPYDFPLWQDQLVRYLERYHEETNLNRSSLTVWGMDTCPIGTSIAVAFTFHPRGILHYTTSGQARTGLIVRPALLEGEFHELPTLNLQKPEEFNAEAIILSLRQFLSAQISKYSFTNDNILKGLKLNRIEPESQSVISSPERLDSPEAIIKAMRKIFFGYSAQIRKLNILISMTLGKVPEYKSPHIMFRDVHTLLMEISSISRMDPENEHITAAYDAAGNEDRSFNAGDTLALEMCEYCDAQIPLNDLEVAICENGHNFPRCSLSFLAITGSGLSKYCGICKRLYLNEPLFDDDGSQTASQSDSESDSQFDNETRKNDEGALFSFKNLLYSACDTCLYCGGRFFSAS